MAKKVRSQLLQNAQKAVIDYLARQGQQMVDDAYRTKETHDKSGNMRDAYGWAVYVNGAIVRRGDTGAQTSTKVHKGWEKHNIPANTGRGYLDDFFDTYQDVPERGMALVVVNAVYYTSILEDGAQGRPSVPVSAQYRIISQVADSIYDIKRHFKGSVVKAISPTE